MQKFLREKIAAALQSERTAAEQAWKEQLGAATAANVAAQERVEQAESALAKMRAVHPENACADMVPKTQAALASALQERDKAEIKGLFWAASQVCRWYDETKCREKHCPCVPIQDRVQELRNPARAVLALPDPKKERE